MLHVPPTPRCINWPQVSQQHIQLHPFNVLFNGQSTKGHSTISSLSFRIHSFLVPFSLSRLQLTLGYAYLLTPLLYCLQCFDTVG